MILVRQETPDDYAAVYALTELAFTGTEHADGDEQDIAPILRKRAGFRPELSLVAEREGQVVGHILFTEITIGETSALCLGPLAVLPELQGRGIGAMLVQKGHEAARKLGFSVCVLVGHENYYPRFGYEIAGEYGIILPVEAPEGCKMVKFLREEGKLVRGTAVFPPELIG
jgi:predicted N-acetyltransferase YhbS